MAEYLEKYAVERAFKKAYGRDVYFSDDMIIKDVAPIQHAKWNKVYSNKVATVYECSNCEHITLGASEYCICGAKMDLEGKR